MGYVTVLTRPEFESDVTFGAGGIAVSTVAANNPMFAMQYSTTQDDMLVMGGYRTAGTGTPNPNLAYNKTGNTGAARFPIARHCHAVIPGALNRAGCFIGTARNLLAEKPAYYDFQMGVSCADFVCRAVDLTGWGGLVGAAHASAYNGAAKDSHGVSIEVVGTQSLLVAVAVGVSANLGPASAPNFLQDSEQVSGPSAPGDVYAAFFRTRGGEAGALEQFLATFAAQFTDFAAAVLEIR